MSTPSRATLLHKIQKFLKRTYKYTPVKGEQPLLESMLFACCLENARHDVARQALAKLRSAFFDWNEVRVSTVKELAEVVAPLPEPGEAAARVKGILQCVFESDYSFELEHLKKQNIGAAVKRLQKLQGATQFNVAYATQSALGGHSIPLDKGTLGVLVVLGLINDSEAQAGVVPGMERAIPKNKGQEFGALLHELGADFFANPFSPALRERLLSIAPDAKDRFPKRTSKKPPAEPVPAAAPIKASPDGKKKDAKRDGGKEPVAAKKQKTIEKPAARATKGASPAEKKAASSARKSSTPTLAKRKPR
jgi:endonuclease-3